MMRMKWIVGRWAAICVDSLTLQVPSENHRALAPASLAVSLHWSNTADPEYWNSAGNRPSLGVVEKYFRLWISNLKFQI
jgi:hypothetical protein